MLTADPTARVLDEARRYKQLVIEQTAKLMGIHDPELPDVEIAEAEAKLAMIALFDALADLDGPLPHEQNTMAAIRQGVGP